MGFLYCLTASKKIGPVIRSMKFGPSAHRQNVASLNLFCWYCRCFSELAQLIPQPDFQRRSACYSKRLYDFSVDIPRFYKDGYVNSLFPHTARLCNSLPVEFFPLISDRNGTKSRVNRYLLSLVLSNQLFFMSFIFFLLHLIVSHIHHNKTHCIVHPEIYKQHQK